MKENEKEGTVARFHKKYGVRILAATIKETRHNPNVRTSCEKKEKKEKEEKRRDELRREEKKRVELRKEERRIGKERREGERKGK
ncbi:hypothetical protein E2C01_072627 [Portunus trituberculatus]|uniref:Uncharacterized protein n=1 Tax=Portunus trituberculatus TaxID=210409 RepID=A0A5B7I7P5_PORTR|nr:hypothetical protein [Portunus trituberculatus]